MLVLSFSSCLPPPSLPLQCFGLRPRGGCLQLDSEFREGPARILHTIPGQELGSFPGRAGGASSFPRKPCCLVIGNMPLALLARFGPLSPRENRKQPPPSLPTASFVPTTQLWKVSEGHSSGSTLWCLCWLAPFPFCSFFFFNNQSSRKCGELTAWQQQRNSLEKPRWILLRFQALLRESQRSNRLRVVFNHFFCGTFLVHETNLRVRPENTAVGRRLWFGDYCSDINYFLLTPPLRDGTCPSWRRPLWVIAFKCCPLQIRFKIVNNVHKLSLQKLLQQPPKFRGTEFRNCVL